MRPLARFRFAPIPPWMVVTLALALGLAAAALAGWPPPLAAEDVSQTRLDIALPLPPPNQPIIQTFTSHHDGLASIELLLVQYGAEGEGGNSA